MEHAHSAFMELGRRLRGLGCPGTVVFRGDDSFGDIENTARDSTGEGIVKVVIEVRNGSVRCDHCLQTS